jgi:serine/threonine protein kinase
MADVSQLPESRTKSADKEVSDVSPCPNYRIIDVLGEGTFGKVYQVENIQNQTRHAMKIYKNYYDEGVSEDAISEMNVLAKTNHPNVLKADFLSLNECRLCLILPLAESSLYQNVLKLYKGPKTPPSEVQLQQLKSNIFSLISGLAYLHKNYIIHTDIKEENILIVNGVFKIADFGTSDCDYITNQPYRRITSIQYRAPEILAVNYSYNNKVDIWSMGIVIVNLIMNTLYAFKRKYFYQLITERNETEIINQMIDLIGPFPNTMIQRANKVYKTTFNNESTSGLAKTVLQYIPQEYSELISKMLTIDPEQRISAEEALNLSVFQEFKYDLPVIEYAKPLPFLNKQQLYWYKLVMYRLNKKANIHKFSTYIVHTGGNMFERILSSPFFQQMVQQNTNREILRRNIFVYADVISMIMYKIFYIFKKGTLNSPKKIASVHREIITVDKVLTIECDIINYLIKNIHIAPINSILLFQNSKQLYEQSLESFQRDLIQINVNMENAFDKAILAYEYGRLDIVFVILNIIRSTVPDNEFTQTLNRLALRSTTESHYGIVFTLINLGINNIDRIVAEVIRRRNGYKFAERLASVGGDVSYYSLNQINIV